MDMCTGIQEEGNKDGLADTDVYKHIHLWKDIRAEVYTHTRAHAHIYIERERKQDTHVYIYIYIHKARMRDAHT